jgi:amino acid adenylation domain-containing protein
MKTGISNALHARFLRGLALSPDGVAIRVGQETVSYAQAHELALRWGGALAGTRASAVGVLASKGVVAYVGVLAALYAGATVVPLRPDFPVARTRQMIDAARVGALIVDDKGLALVPELTGGSAGIAVLAPDASADGPWLSPNAEDALSQPCEVAPTDAAYVLFTSGSTGRPKGVTITHGSTAHYFGLLDQRYDFGPSDVFSQTFDLNFDCAMFDMFCAWGAGAEVLAIPPAAYRDLPAFLAQRGVTVWFSTPSAIDLIRKLGGLGADALSGLRWSFFAGEALTCRDVADWRVAAPASAVENLYGPTELTITIAGYRWSDELTPAIAINGVVPIGAVHGGHDHLLLDDDGRSTDDEGELCIAGPQLTPGYLDPADEPGRFLNFDGKRWYRTGDRVRRLGGDDLAYLGRLDSQVQVQGWRVELTEVEHALRGLVHDAVTVGVSGAGGLELFVFYTGAEVPTVSLIRALRKVLPDGVIPKHYRNVDEFPLNANRKVDRKALTALATELRTGAPVG